MHGLALVAAFVAALAACGKKDKRARELDAALPVVVPAPPPGSLVGKEPPTAESVHVELAYALAHWSATEHAKDHANIHGASIKTWLDPGTQLTLDQSKVIVDHAREQMWQRAAAEMQLFSDQVRPAPVHDELEIDAALLGPEVTARFTSEASFAWLVLENPTGAQVVLDLWPDAPCKRADMSKLACGVKEFTLVRTGDVLTLSPDRTIKLAKDAKLTFK